MGVVGDSGRREGVVRGMCGCGGVIVGGGRDVSRRVCGCGG